MKQLFLILSIFIISLAGVKAQGSVEVFQSDQGVHADGIDTISGTASVITYLKVIGKVTNLTITTGVTKLTGTPTTGFSVKLYGSVDKVRWDPVTSATDTLAVTNVAPEQPKTWKLSTNAYLWYKIVGKGFGTQTSKLFSNALIRP